MNSIGMLPSKQLNAHCCDSVRATAVRSRCQVASASPRSSFLCGEGSSSMLLSWIRIHHCTSGQAKRRVTSMAAKVTGYIKLALEAGKANPAPPVGPALGSKGVNIMSFCKEYNAATQEKAGQVIPVEITVFEDRSFTFVLKTPPASFLLKKAAKIGKGAGEPNMQKVGEITQEQLREIAETKLPDLNCTKIESAMKVIAGTARNMGIKIQDPQEVKEEAA